MLVTDDELIAASAATDNRWTGALPSVDLSAADALIQPAARGARSLLVRGLVDEDGGFRGEGAEELAIAVAGTVRALVYPAATGSANLPVGPSVGLIDADDSWVIDVTAPDGTHDLTAIDGSEAAWRAIETIVATAGELPDDRVLTVISVGTDPAEGVFVSIKGDSALTTPLTAEGTGPEVLTAITAADALKLIRDTFHS